MGLKVDLGNGVKSDVGNNGGYQLLGQAALNNYEAYQKSLYYNLIANSYESGTQKEEVYNKALEVLDINLDSFEAILNLYKQKGDKVTSANWLEFAKRVISTYTYYPMAMTDLLRVINPYLNREDALEVDMLKTEALNKALNATDGEVLQSGACREIARELLGSDKVDLASFSFDGENAGKIVMNSKYDDYDFQVQYSLDGGNTWETSLEHKIVLSKKQMISTQKYSQLNIKIKDFFNSFELIKCFQITHHVIHQFDYVENEYETSMQNYRYDEGIISGFSTLSSLGVSVMTTLISLYFVIINRITIGEMLAITQLANNIANPLGRLSNEIPLLKSIKPIENKIETLAQYRYCICFENNCGHNGYVSEKIFDCIFAECVPIYLGAPDINRYIPEDCFIDMRKFHDYDELYAFIENIDDKQWNEYICAMKKFAITLLSQHRYDGEAMAHDINEAIRYIEDKY